MRLVTALSLWVLGLGPVAAHTLQAPHAHAVVGLEHVAAVFLIAGVVGLAVRRIKRVAAPKSPAD